MGVLNVTPDSFSDGGRYEAPGVAADRAIAMESEGASIIDIGGESTRPQAEAVTLEEELRRVIPVVRAVRKRSGIVISIDTTKAGVADEALRSGADIVNDISALTSDPTMLDVTLRWKAGAVLMHMQGRPVTMQKAPTYGDVVNEVREFLRQAAARAIESGMLASGIVVDPGIGFGKKPEHNLALLQNLPSLMSLGFPILLGVSNKSFLKWLADAPSIPDRLWPGVAVTAFGRQAGARVFRVHDVGTHHQALRMTEAIFPSHA